MALQSCRTALSRSRHALRTFAAPQLRTLATDATTPDATTPESFTIPKTADAVAAPRWSRTPPGMKAPMQINFAKDSQNKVWAVNNDPARLDEMYDRLLGQGGSAMLPEELKWLAVTHKSFDQGRRGFNNRLALMGRMTLIMEATKEIVSQQPLEGTRHPDSFDRQPFEHEQLLSVDNLNVKGPKDLVGKEKLQALANSVELLDVIRWKPRMPADLELSGVEVVLAGGILAIIGAITLQHGSVVASKVVQERILARVQNL